MFQNAKMEKINLGHGKDKYESLKVIKFGLKNFVEVMGMYCPKLLQHFCHFA